MNDFFVKLNEEFLRALFADAEFQKMKAFGKQEAFLKSEKSNRITGNRFVKYGLAYTYAMDKGIKLFPPIAPLIDWVGLKKYGINFSSPQEQKSIAFAIARNMQKRGSYKFRRPSDMYGRAFEKAIQNSKRELYANIRRNFAFK